MSQPCEWEFDPNIAVFLKDMTCGQPSKNFIQDEFRGRSLCDPHFLEFRKQFFHEDRFYKKITEDEYLTSLVVDS